LEAKKLHNVGNSYAKLGEIDRAIKAYKDALKVKFDEDTKYNLDLLKEKKEEQKQKNDQNQNEQQDKNRKDNRDKKDNQIRKTKITYTDSKNLKMI